MSECFNIMNLTILVVLNPGLTSNYNLFTRGRKKKKNIRIPSKVVNLTLIINSKFKQL